MPGERVDHLPPNALFEDIEIRRRLRGDPGQGRGEQRRARLRAYEAWVEVSTEARNLATLAKLGCRRGPCRGILAKFFTAPRPWERANSNTFRI
jgi:hypothetical protein